MNIKVFKMKLYPGKADEYRKRHDEIWPELVKLLAEHGVYDYTIYLDEETNTLFASHKVKSEAKFDSLPQHVVMRKWWDYMSDLMETNEDKSPKMTPLSPVFILIANKEGVIKEEFNSILSQESKK